MTKIKSSSRGRVSHIVRGKALKKLLKREKFSLFLSIELFDIQIKCATTISTINLWKRTRVLWTRVEDGLLTVLTDDDTLDRRALELVDLITLEPLEWRPTGALTSSTPVAVVVMYKYMVVAS